MKEMEKKKEAIIDIVTAFLCEGLPGSIGDGLLDLGLGVIA